jgi:hypothetical protein
MGKIRDERAGITRCKACLVVADYNFYAALGDVRTFYRPCGMYGSGVALGATAQLQAHEVKIASAYRVAEYDVDHPWRQVDDGMVLLT